jgi:hypothetical protein
MILVDGESTGGCLGLIHDVVPAGHAGPLLHLHPAFDEHTFANRTAIDVPVLMFVTPAGFERYFADGAAQADSPDEFTVVVGGRLGEQPDMGIS